MNNNYLILLVAIPLIVLTGTLGFSYYEHQTTLDAFYFTMITISSVGYGDIVPLTTEGKFLASAISVLGIGAFVTTVPIVMFSLIEKSVKKVGKMKPNIKNHVIVCGYNPIAKKIISNLIDKKEKIVVITSSSEEARRLEEEKIHVIIGDPTEEETLIKAKVDVAKSLLPVMDEDADNLLTTISSRTINKQIKIIAKVSQEKNISKLRKSGANEVFSPETLVGSMIAESAIK